MNDPQEVAMALQKIRPGAIWNLSGDQLTWLDTNSTKPTDAEIQQAVLVVKADKAKYVTPDSRLDDHEKRIMALEVLAGLKTSKS